MPATKLSAASIQRKWKPDDCCNMQSGLTYQYQCLFLNSVYCKL